MVLTTFEFNNPNLFPTAVFNNYGCDFPGNYYGELFFLMEPGILICPSHMGVKPLAGMHGFAPEDKDSTASFMSSVAVEFPPRRLEDLYTLMHDDIGMRESPEA